MADPYSSQTGCVTLYLRAANFGHEKNLLGGRIFKPRKPQLAINLISLWNTYNLYNLENVSPFPIGLNLHDLVAEFRLHICYSTLFSGNTASECHVDGVISK